MDITENVEEIKDEDMMDEDDADDDSSEESSGDDEDVVKDKTEKDENDESESVQAKPKAFLPGEEIEEGEELVMDDQAYTIYHQASLGPPCLSFDIIPDHLGNDRADSYPLTMYGVAGTQATKMS